MKSMGRILGYGAILLAVANCSGEESGSDQILSRFRTSNPHLKNAEIALNVHGGVRELGDHLDFDGDGVPDLYVVGNDGAFFYTGSRRLIQGEDSARNRTWVSGDLELLRYIQGR